MSSLIFLELLLQYIGQIFLSRKTKKEKEYLGCFYISNLDAVLSQRNAFQLRYRTRHTIFGITFLHGREIACYEPTKFSFNIYKLEVCDARAQLIKF